MGEKWEDPFFVRWCRLYAPDFRTPPAGPVLALPYVKLPKMLPRFYKSLSFNCIALLLRRISGCAYDSSAHRAANQSWRIRKCRRGHRA